MVPGQRAGSGKAAAGFRSPRPSAGWFGGGRRRPGGGSAFPAWEDSGDDHLVRPVLQMVSSDFVGRKEDPAALRREGDGSFSRFLCCSSVANPDSRPPRAVDSEKSLVHKTPSVRRTTLGLLAVRVDVTGDGRNAG